MAVNYVLDQIKASDVMTANVITASPKEPLSEILAKMRKYDLSEIPVIDGEILVGLVTHSQIVRRRNLPMHTEAERVMAIPPVILAGDPVTRIAETLLSNNFRAVPVVDRVKRKERRLAGIVARLDIIRKLAQVREIMQTPLVQIMTPTPICVRENDTVVKARHIMRELDERAVPVIDAKDMLVGVVGYKDLLKLSGADRAGSTDGQIPGEKSPVELAVNSIMNMPPIHTGPEGTVGNVIRLIIENNISTVIMTDAQKRPVGIVTEADIMELVAKFEERAGVYVQITGMEEDPETLDAMYSMIQKSMKKLSHLYLPQTLIIHVSESHMSQYLKGSETSNYSLSARLQTKHGLFVAKTSDWHLMTATSTLLEHLETQVRREREREKELPRRRLELQKK